MLTPFQREKVTHFFRVLDQDKNNLLEVDDFTEIGQDLCILWGFKPDTPEHLAIIDRCEHSWRLFEASFEAYGRCANLEQFLIFAEHMISPQGEEVYHGFIALLISDFFDFFDVNKDGVITINEYVDMFMAYHIAIKYSGKAFTKIDRDADDEITKEELLQALVEFFKSDDKNAPGNWLFGFWGEDR
jgi:Ca2+-binding EF-hand superfamily protein